MAENGKSAGTPSLNRAKTASRQRGSNLRIGGEYTEIKRKIATKGKRQFASAGPYTHMDAEGLQIVDSQLKRIRREATTGMRYGNEGWGMYELVKTASLFSDGLLGSADIADSGNIGYYSYEFPVDALELPASRAEELRFYRLAYDRDPIVGRAIDMHTELPLSKWSLEKPKSSSDDFSDYVFDYYTRLCTNTGFFEVLIQAVREYWNIGESFLFIEEPPDVKPCEMALKVLEKERKKQGKGSMGDASEPTMDAENPQLGGMADRILDFIEPAKKASWLKKRASEIREIVNAGIPFSPDEDAKGVRLELRAKRANLSEASKQLKAMLKLASMRKVAQPPDAPPPPAAGGADPPAGGEGAPVGDAGLEGVEGIGEGMEGAPPMPMGGGGGGGGFPMGPPGPGGETDVDLAVAQGASAEKQRELLEMKRYVKLLEKKRQILEELKELKEKRLKQEELFSHVTNADYDGFNKIQVLPPEQIELAAEGKKLTDGPTIYYKPLDKQKEAYMQDEDVDSEVKGKLQQEGKVPLNQDPYKGSYVCHLARKKSGYELHGRSILQRCIRTVIYREKLRQVQSTLASRNMTPKTLVTAPGVPASELMALRAHIDEAKADPDYSIVVNYEARWDEIGSEGRLLSLDSEWQHTNSDLSIGLGFSPEILIGEGLYSGNKVQLQLIETSYLQFRDVLGTLVEQKIFKPIAMRKGFYEMDKWGNPRWVYPKISFSRLALRDQGDVFDMLYNLYTKGSIPISIILELLEVDPEDAKRKLEEDLFTVNDAKFNELLSGLYNAIGQAILDHSDILQRVISGLTLNEKDKEPEEGPEGTGQGA